MLLLNRRCSTEAVQMLTSSRIFESVPSSFASSVCSLSQPNTATFSCCRNGQDLSAKDTRKTNPAMAAARPAGICEYPGNTANKRMSYCSLDFAAIPLNCACSPLLTRSRVHKVTATGEILVRTTFQQTGETLYSEQIFGDCPPEIPQCTF